MHLVSFHHCKGHKHSTTVNTVVALLTAVRPGRSNRELRVYLWLQLCVTEIPELSRQCQSTKSYILHWTDTKILSTSVLTEPYILVPHVAPKLWPELS